MSWQQALKKITKLQLFNRDKVYPELVSEITLNQLRRLASRATPVSLDINMEVHQKMLGERLSPFARSGFEFAETRLYQAGDNVRFINWRRFANSGELYINTFHEERRPQCWLVMDRRASMRFGTRVRLKAAQAAIYSLYHLFKAQQHQMDIGGIVLDQKLAWYEAKASVESLYPLIRHIKAPCPPMPDKADDQLHQALRLLNVRISPGCLIVIVSDFLDLSDSDVNTLSELANKHTVAAVHIVDPIEVQLPDQGQYNVLQQRNQSIVSLDCSNRNQQQHLNHHLQQRLLDTEKQLKQCHVQFKLAYSDEGMQQDNIVEFK